MGGSIRKDFSARVTHLVANCTSGEKYRVSFLIFSLKFSLCIIISGTVPLPQVKEFHFHLVSTAIVH